MTPRVVADVVVAETDGGVNICPAAAHLASSWRTRVLIANRSLIESISQASPPSCHTTTPKKGQFVRTSRRQLRGRATTSAGGTPLEVLI